MSIPADAGPVIRDVRKRSRTSVVIVAVLAVVLSLVVAGDPRTWPLLAVFGGAGVVAWLVYKLRKRAIAICEHGLVVAKAGRATVVPWDRVNGLRIIRGRYTSYVIDYDDTNCLLTDHSAGGWIEQRLRGRRRPG